MFAAPINPIFKRHLVLTFCLSATLLLPAASGQTVTFADDTFDNLDWSLQVRGDAPFFSASGQQVGSGGNPDAFRRVNVSLNTNGGTSGGFVTAFHWLDSASYDPTVSGPLESIDFSINHLRIATPPAHNGQGFGLALKQNGYLYRASIFFTQTLSGWQNTQDSSITPGDIRGNAGAPDIDFSGSEIGFGFYTAHSSPNNRTNDMLTVGYDNYQVDLHVVPEPTTVCLMGLGAVALLRRRRVR